MLFLWIFREITINTSLGNISNTLSKSGFINPINDDLPQGEFVQILITDQGHGIPKSVIKKVFDPFFSTKKNTGTGLGSVEVFWNGGGASAAAQYANSATIFHLNMQGEFGLGEQLPSILNNSGDGVHANTVGNGDLGIQTTGAIANSAYTLIITLRKNNQMYARGQFQEPSAFNYGQYKLTL